MNLSDIPLLGQFFVKRSQLGGRSGRLALAGDLVPLPLKIGEWFFNEGIGPLTLNQVGAYPSANMFLQGNDLSLGGWTYTVGSTRTARYSPDPVGGHSATRVEITSGGAYGAGVGQTVTLEAKAYTMSCWVKSNTGSSQEISAYIYNGNTVADFTVPATGWVLYSNTFTSTAGAKILLPVSRASTGAAVDISVWGAQLEPGSAVSTSRDNGNVALGGGAAWNSTGIDFHGAGRWATAIIPAVNAATISMYVTAKWPTANAALNSTWQGIIGGYGDEPVWIAAYCNSKGPGVGTFSSESANLLVLKKDQLKDDLWHTLTATYDGATLKLYIDGDLVQNTTATIAAGLVTKLLVGNLQGTSFPFPGTIAYGSIYGTAHTPTQIRAECARIASILSPRGITTDPRTSYLIFDGTSITAGTGASAATTAWTAVANAALGNLFGVNIGTGSALVSTLAGRATLVDAQAGAGRAKRLLIVDVGTNDIALSNSTAATAFAALKAYCQARQAAGFKVLVGTQISRTGTFGGAGGGSMDAQIQAYNALIRADSSFYDGLIDWAGNSNLGDTGAYASSTYFNVDGIHPKDAGHALMGGIAATAIAAVLADS